MAKHFEEAPSGDARALGDQILAASSELGISQSTDVEVTLGADSVIADEASILDWGALVVESQGGTSVYVVGLSPKDAAALLRRAADALD
jgi:hypothetical protein